MAASAAYFASASSISHPMGLHPMILSGSVHSLQMRESITVYSSMSSWERESLGRSVSLLVPELIPPPVDLGLELESSTMGF